jgi:surface antigen
MSILTKAGRVKPGPATRPFARGWVLVTVATLTLTLSLTACQTPPGGTIGREEGGMIIGGVLGGVLGSQVGHGSGRTAATILGTIAGAAIGGSVGRSMAETDRLKTAHALETVQTGVPARWVNPDNGNRYEMVPTRTFDQGGQPCRDYTIDAIISGAKQKVTGTACRQADGVWRATP